MKEKARQERFIKAELEKIRADQVVSVLPKGREIGNNGAQRRERVTGKGLAPSG